MKLYSPFLFVFLFIAIEVLSCTDSKSLSKENIIDNDSISKHIEIGNNEKIAPKERLKSLNEAYILAKKIKNDSLLYTVVAYKSTVMNAYFPKDSPEVLNQLHKLINGKKRREAYYKSRLADYFLYKQQYESAYKYYNDSKLLYLQLNNNNGAGYNLVKIAWINTLLNDYNSTQENAVEAMKVLEHVDNNEYKSSIYQSLGNSFSGLKQYDLAIENYSKASKLSKDDEAVQIAIQNNIANINIINGNYKSAIDSLSKVLKLKLLRTDLEKFAAILDNLGYAKLRNGDKSGMIEMQQALQINKNENYTDNLAKIYLHFAEYYTTSNKQLAIDYAKKAYIQANISKAVDDRIAALKKLFKLTTGEISREYAFKYDNLKDSIIDVRAKQRNDFALGKYNLSVANRSVVEADNRFLRSEVRNQKERSIVIIGVSILISCGVWLYFLYRAKYRREKLKEVYNTETRISKKLHDELANDVYSAMTFAGKNELSPENKENLVTKLYDIYSRTRNISTENASIDTGANFGAHFREMIGAYNDDQVKVVVQGLEGIDWNAIDDNKKVALYRVTHELLVNMKKHSQCSFAMLTFKIIKNNLYIDYNDNGVGVPTDTIISKKGLLNVENRIRAIKGTVTFDNTSDKGFKLNIVFPI